jgi:orotate phosphoribosyltransferase
MDNETIRHDIGFGIAKLLFEARAIHISRRQPFTLAAGWASPVYVDCRLLFGDAAVRRQVIDLAAEYIAATFVRDQFDAIAGAETAGIAFAALLAEKTGLAFRYVRKRPLGIGRNAQVECGPVEGLRVLLADDLTTDGASKLAFGRGLRAAGATVDHALSIFYHNAFAGARERLGEAHLTSHALATWTEALAAMPDAYWAHDDRVALSQFLADPIDWSTRNGGRATGGVRPAARTGV